MFLLFYFWIGIKKDCYFNLFMNCLYGIPSLPWIHFKILSYFSLLFLSHLDDFLIKYTYLWKKVQLKLMKGKIYKISSTLSYYFHSEGGKFKGKKSNFLQAFIGIMGNVYILFAFESRLQYLAQVFLTLSSGVLSCMSLALQTNPCRLILNLVVYWNLKQQRGHFKTYR